MGRLGGTGKKITKITPLILAAALGRNQALKFILKNPTLDLSTVEQTTGANAFWFAAFFGRGRCLKLLAEAGANILSKHRDSGANALHVAVERKHLKVVEMLIESGYPLYCTMRGGLTALILSSRSTDDISVRICRKLIEGGVDVNKITDEGDSALSLAILNDNKRVVEMLIKVQADLMYQEESLVENSPFFKAIRAQKKWAVEAMCDSGIDLQKLKANGRTALLYSAINGFHDICMYLCLRVREVDIEDEETG